MTGLSWQEIEDGVGEVHGPAGQPLARYSWLRANNPYFDELRPLTHAGVLTTHAPHDHRWHHGLWWSWKFLNDVLFWEDHPDYGGNRAGLGRAVVTAHDAAEVDGAVVLQEALEWRVNETNAVLLTEERTMRLALDADIADAWHIDWDQHWTATTPVRFEVTPWPESSWGGYAGLNYRPARAQAGEESILAAGASGVDEVHGRRAPWAAYTGLVDGAETDEPNRPASGGVALLQHPGNPRYPDPIYTFSAATDFGFLATAPLMRDGLTLDAGEALRIRTRVLVLPAQADAEQLEAAQASFVAIPEAVPEPTNA